MSREIHHLLMACRFKQISKPTIMMKAHKKLLNTEFHKAVAGCIVITSGSSSSGVVFSFSIVVSLTFFF